MYIPLLQTQYDATADGMAGSAIRWLQRQSHLEKIACKIGSSGGELPDRIESALALIHRCHQNPSPCPIGPLARLVYGLAPRVKSLVERSAILPSTHLKLEKVVNNASVKRESVPGTNGMKLIMARVLLGLSGALLLLIGAAVLFQPEAFASANGITLSDSPSMRSEYRAPGGLLLVSAVIVLLGSVRQNLMRISLALAALVYSSYGISRLIAMTTDGMPSAALTQATIIELLLGLTSLIVLLRVDRSWANQGPR